MARLFGTDGVRGVAGDLLTAELAVALGRAAAAEAKADAPQVLIVRDTRESGEMLEAALAAGVAAGGGHALLGGVLPTPGAALLVRRYEFDLAAVVSASHNPYRDNGIKLFGSAGTKIPDEVERRIEQQVQAGAQSARGPHRPRARAARRHRRLPARAGAALQRAGPVGPEGAARLRERGHLPSGARDLPSPGRRCRDRGRRARRAQHQRRLRLHPRRGAGPAGGGGRVRRGLRLRRRRRPRAGGGPRGRGGRRRRAARPVRAAPARLRAPAGRRRGGDRDDQLRLPSGDAATRAWRWPPPR